MCGSCNEKSGRRRERETKRALRDALLLFHSFGWRAPCSRIISSAACARRRRRSLQDKMLLLRSQAPAHNGSIRGFVRPDRCCLALNSKSCVCLCTWHNKFLAPAECFVPCHQKCIKFPPGRLIQPELSRRHFFPAQITEGSK